MTKAFVRHFLNYNVPYPILGNFLRFTYVENKGIAFGIFDSTSNHIFLIKNILLLCITLTIIVLLCREIKREKSFINLLAFYMIIGGALGNMLERLFGTIFYKEQFKLFYGKVTDFIDVGFATHRFYYFNIADSFISIGVTLLTIHILFFKDKKA